MRKIEIIKGDITKAKTDVIVNSANSTLLGGGGVDGAIHRAAGPELLKACMDIPEKEGVRCPVGCAKITPAFNLDAKYIIHTVGPKYGLDNHIYLKLAYQNSLTLALEYRCKSIAFPAISCGIYDYPIKKAAIESKEICDNFPNIDIKFYLFEEEVYQTWKRIYEGE